MSKEDDKSPSVAETESEEPFLARWSRRKTAAGVVATEASAENPVIAPEPEQKQAPPAPDLTDDDMPPIESLHPDSDFAEFMSPKVSDNLRRMALRKLFHLPQFNVIDGLNDYDEDYTEFAPLGDILTHEVKRLRELSEKLAGEEEKVEDSARPPNDSTEQRKPELTEESTESADQDTSDFPNQGGSPGIPRPQ